jgi:hypothetical protein
MDVAALLGGPPHSCRRQSSLKSVVTLTRFRVSEEGGLFETRAAARPVSTTSAIGSGPPAKAGDYHLRPMLFGLPRIFNTNP